MIKRRNSNKYSQPFAWLDLVFNIMMSFAFLFVLSYILINVNKKKQEIEKPKAEVLVVMTWPDYAVEDIDLWLLLPNGETVSFTRKEVSLIALERDDLGLSGDTTVDEAGVVRVSPVNKEVITFRALPVGKYQVSAHYYSARGGPEMAAQLPVPQPVPGTPYLVKVEIIVLNPTVKQAFVRERRIEHVGQEVPFVSFSIEESGNVTDFKKDNLDPFIPLSMNGGNSSWVPGSP